MNEILEKELPVVRLIQIAGQVFTKSYIYIILVCIIVYLPVNIINLLIPAEYYELLYDMTELTHINNETAKQILKLFIVKGALQISFLPLVEAGVFYCVSQTLNENKIEVSGILNATIYNWWKLALTSLIYFGAIILTITLILPALYISVSFFFFTCIITFSNRWGLDALLESRQIIKGRWMKALGYLLLTVIFSMLISSIIIEVLYLIPFIENFFVNVIFSTMAQTCGCIVIVFISVWFFNWNFIRKSNHKYF